MLTVIHISHITDNKTDVGNSHHFIDSNSVHVKPQVGFKSMS